MPGAPARFLAFSRTSVVFGSSWSINMMTSPYVRIDPVLRAVDSVYVAIRGLGNRRIH